MKWRLEKQSNRLYNINPALTAFNMRGVSTIKYCKLDQLFNQIIEEFIDIFLSSS